MGSSTNYKKKFYANHPICCFCGGNSPATTIDHVPARATFNNRSWPEGYDFPACQSCNSSSAQNEQIVALLARIGASNPSPSETAEYQKLLKGLENNQPEVLLEMQPAATQVRGFLRDNGLKLEQGQLLRDVPVLSVRGPLIKAAVNEFARKLFLSLHYKHTGKIVPQVGGIAIKWITNSTRNNREFV